MDETKNSIKILPCDISNKLIESGCEEKVNNNRGNYGLDNKKLVLNLLFIILGLLL